MNKNNEQYIKYLEGYIELHCSLFCKNIEESIKTFPYDTKRINENIKSSKNNYISYCLIKEYFYKNMHNYAGGYIARIINNFSEFLNDFYNEEEFSGNGMEGYIFDNDYIGFETDKDENYEENNITFFNYGLKNPIEEKITYTEIYKYLEIANKVYTEFFPQNQKYTAELLKKIKIKYKI